MTMRKRKVSGSAVVVYWRQKAVIIGIRESENNTHKM